MPNHITNKFIYISNEEKFNLLCRTDKGVITFEKLIPMPNTLQISARSSRNLVDTYDNEELVKIVTDMENKEGELYDTLNNECELDEYLNKGLDLLENVKFDNNRDKVLFLMQLYNKTLYGYTDWYDWCRENWGTKWNAYHAYEYDYEFDTAWSIPYKWLEKVGKFVDYIMYFADEDVGNNFGCVVAKNGVTKVYQYTEQGYGDLENMIIAMYLKNYYEDLDDLKVQLIDNYEVDKVQAEELVNRTESLVEGFIKFAQDKFNELESGVA